MPLMDVATINAVKKMLADYPDLDLNHKKYGYYEESWDFLDEYYVMALMSPPAFPLLEVLKNQTNLLTAEKVQKIGVNEVFYFWKLDSDGMVYVLGPPIISLIPPPSPQNF